ncbi:Ger(x)C family spore germination protein [Alicyclobacillus curvatus]|nr:Ger(x)C family spore germination protein [Alicyclobacillus curvatus]
MKPRIAYIIVITVSLCLLLTTGCWDMTEPNQRALWVASALDETSNGRIEFSGQIAVPSALGEGGGGGGGGAKGTSYVVKSAVGSNVEDAMQNIQEQISRRAYVGHRDAIFIGERMARHGLKEFIDELGRNPESNVRSKVYLIKGASGKRFLHEDVDLEQFSTTVALRASRYNGIRDVVTSLRDFDNKMLSDGIRPTMQVVSLSSAGDSRDADQQHSNRSGSTFHLAGIALFNKNAQLVGYLDEDEANLALWATGDLTKHTVSGFMQQGNGYVSLDLQHLRRRVKSVINGNDIHVRIHLTGTGMIRENSSSLNLFQRQNVEYVERQFDQSIERQMAQILSKVQSEYDTDIFGIGEDVHRRYPVKWKTLKSHWDDEFKRLQVTVDVKLSVRHIGNKGPSFTIPDRNS